MIQIEGTSPLIEDNQKNKKENQPPLPDVSSKVEIMLGQQSLPTNDSQSANLNTQQNTEINSITPQDTNKENLENNESGSNLNSNPEEEEENNKDEQTNDNDNGQKENDNKKNDENEVKLKNIEVNNNEIDNGQNEKKTNESNENTEDIKENSEDKIGNTDDNKDGNDDEKKQEESNENNEDKLESTDNSKDVNDDEKSEKKLEESNEINENKLDNKNDDGKNEEIENENNDSKNETKTEDTTDTNEDNENQTNKDLTTDQSNIETDRSTNSQFSNKPISFYLNQVDPKEVEDALESLISHQSQPCEQLRDPVMQLINRKKLDALIERDYDLAEKYDQTSEILQKGNDDLLFERSERIRKLTIDDRSESITEKKSKLQEKYNSKIEEIKTERRTALENLQAQHNNENAAFQSKWQDPNFISKYKKPSPELIQLRFVEKKLALSKFYDEAKEKKIWADKQQKIEEKQTQIIIEGEMKKDFFRMKDQQLFQLKKVADYYDSLIKNIELQRNKELQALDYALKQCEVKKNTIPNRKLHSIPKELTQMNDKITDTSMTAKMSPRTLSKLAKFRNEKKGKICVSPISESTFSKLIAAHPIVRPQSKFKVNNHPPSRLKRL